MDFDDRSDDDMSADDAERCTEWLRTAETAVLDALNRLPVPDARPRVARFVAITALLHLATALMESLAAADPRDATACAGIVAEVVRRLRPYDERTPGRTH